ncbi:DUF3817 domain-containing protein [Nesterenkonia natronophila]|uniref:DUF3817 domain-containing protein n=1 Tax=Nesterenkonia natronophila TaxID=2174932 RepID=A0A3A4G215_9MICC|nr:DUF3817 domain-containing protein [Nesterenkonia natronophila]RJN32159.1 DUF3817 domain-containing protein [Nesterenkonia natronophila]
MSPHLLFRVMAIAEAVSWTLLLGGIVLRATADLDIAVTIGGGIHGFVFLAYAVTSVLVAKNQRMHRWPAAVAIISAIIPYATIPADMWLTRTGRLSGEWRRAPTGDHHDQIWHDRLFRVVLRHPVFSCFVLLGGVSVAFLSLLALGSPLDRLPD